MSPQAVTEFGIVEGEQRQGHARFLGIPFAAPPTGRRRWHAPEPTEPWPGIRAARAFAPAAMQGLSFAPGSAAEGAQSEDCLYLNVYTPGIDSKKRPVMFFIHGGAFIVGSASSLLYDGGPLAELGDVVVVTANYRLGALGYLCLGDLGASWGATANVGALDQIAALRWVSRNIDRFGGDPGAVTVFGESAGATSALNLVSTPDAEGLLHRLIAESPGNAIDIPDAAEAIGVAEQLLRALEIPKTETERLLEIPGEVIVKAQASVKSRLWLGFFPVIDSKTLPRRPRELFAEGGGARVPLVIGTNRDEWNLFEPPKLRKDPAEDATDIATRFLERGFPKRHAERIPSVVETYRRSRSDKGLVHDDAAIVRAVTGDLRFRMPSIRFAEAHARRGLSTHMYFFTHESPAMRGALGACHALELPFVFGTLDTPLQDRFAGTGPAVENLSRAMMSSWLAFARTSDPNDPALGAAWPTYDENRRATLVLDSKMIRLEDAPFDEERAVWDGVL